jgi:hypothetical protein
VNRREREVGAQSANSRRLRRRTDVTIPLVVRSREQHGRRRPEPEDDHPLAAHRIDHRDDIVDPRLQETSFGLVDRIRRARAPRVEPDVPAERRQPFEKTNQRGLVPHEINREQCRSNDNDVNGTRTHHLIRDPTRLRPDIAGLDRVHLASRSKRRAYPNERNADTTRRRRHTLPAHDDALAGQPTANTHRNTPDRSLAQAAIRLRRVGLLVAQIAPLPAGAVSR